VPLQLNSSNVVSDTIDGEVLAIRSDDGAYYSMRGAGATAWVALLGGAPLHDAAAAVAAHHADADVATVRRDLETFAARLVDELLVIEHGNVDDTTVDGTTVDGTVIELPAETAGTPWETPSFERYTDMRDLLLFDPIHEVQPSGWPNVATDPRP